jgi:uncharacterized membrane protein YedE/YeeE
MISVTAPLWVGLLVGVAFGVPASIWGIGNPETVIRTARLVDRLLLGCFLLVTAVGSVLLYGLYAMGFAMHFSPRPVYLVGVTVGGLLFGIGAAISGYFPGTEMIALGEGRREVLFAIPGGLLGAAAWTLLYQTSPGHWLVSAANTGPSQLISPQGVVQDQLLSGRPGVLVVRVPQLRGVTPFDRFGSLPLVLLTAGAAFWRRRQLRLSASTSAAGRSPDRPARDR